jgi:hypothetical protein
MSYKCNRNKGKKMKKIILTIVLTISTLFAGSVQSPDAQYKSSGAVVDLIHNDGKLYSATGASTVDIFDVKSKKIIKQIKVNKIKDFMGEIIDSKIYSIDLINNKILILSQAEAGYRRVHIHQNNKNTLLIPYTDNLYIAKAKFLDKDNILLALLSNEVISYNIKNKKFNWKIQVSQSKFSTFALSEKKDKVVIADESGDLKIIRTKDGKKIKELAGKNLDNVFQVDYKKGIVATAGQDRRVVIYNTIFNSSYYKMANFLIYSVGLSPSGKRVGYASDENNDVTVFNTSTKTELGSFGGNKMTLSNIIFINENEFFVACDDYTINYYKIK